MLRRPASGGARQIPYNRPVCAIGARFSTGGATRPWRPAGNDGDRVRHGGSDTGRRREAPLPDRRDERRRRRRRGGDRDAVRDVVLSERAREGGRRAGRSRHRQARAGPEDRRRMARQGRLDHQPHAADAGVAAEARSAARRSEFERIAAAGRLQERASLDQGQRARDGRHLHAPRLLADVPARRSRRRTSAPTGSAASSARATRSKFDLAGRVYSRRAGADQPAGAAAQVRDATRRSSSAKTTKSA